jgi:hypothetical protein
LRFFADALQTEPFVFVKDHFPHFFRLVLFAACIFSAGCWKKNDPVAEADKFFALVKDDRLKEAYGSAAFGFQAKQTEASFAANVVKLNLAHFASNRWTRVTPGDGEVTLDGEMTTRDGTQFVFTAKMTRDRGRWRLFSLRTHGIEAMMARDPFTLVGRGAAFEDVANRPVPPEAEVQKLARATILDFDDAVRRKSFEDFYTRISVRWQNQVSPKRIRNAFEPFIENKISLASLGIENVQPTFAAPPMVNGEGLLVVTGIFPTKPYRVAFSFKYMYEVPNWKLFGIDVNLVGGG